MPLSPPGARLLELVHEPDADYKAIDTMISKIEVEPLANGASMNLCRYSDEPFNTNEVIWPHWAWSPFIRPAQCWRQCLPRSALRYGA
jgi:hypothetical protein